MRRRILAIAAVVLAGVLLASAARVGGWLGGDTDGRIVVTADFEDTTGVYVGNDVTYLGVQIGEITEVQRMGTSMRVVMHLDKHTELPRDAGAEILQGSLVTDRYIELGPAYTGGPTLPEGANIDAAHTRAPATVDEVAKAIDDLVLALDGALGSKDGADGADLGQVLDAAATTLSGNGTHLRRALAESRDALRVVNAHDADLTAVTKSLNSLVTMLVKRDRQIRTFTHAAADATGLMSDERTSVVATLTALDRLTRRSNRFLKGHGDVLAADLKGIADIVALVHKHQASLSEAFDVMPTMAENFALAYDWDRGRLRVQFAVSVGPLSAQFRNHTCQVLGQRLGGDFGAKMCSALFAADGTGILDPLLDGIYGALPGGFP